MAYEFYVTIDASKQGKLKGESPRQRRDDKLAGLAFHYSVGTSRDSASGMATGRRIHQPVSFVKRWGAASPQIFTALVTNEVLKSVLFEFVRTDERGEEIVFHTIKLSDARVTDIEQYIDPGDTGPLERITVAFQRIELENADGGTSAIDDLKGQR